MDESDDLGIDFTLSAEDLPMAESWFDRYFKSLGYQPPPNQIDETRIMAVIEQSVEGGFRAKPVSPREAALVRETGQSLIEELRAIEPRELAFDPFVGEVELLKHPNLESIRAVFRGEIFVTAVSAEADHVWAGAIRMQGELEAARHLAEDQQRERDKLDLLARENFAHACRLADGLAEAAAEDPLGPTMALRKRYEVDIRTAIRQVERLQLATTMDHLYKIVAEFGESWGPMFDAAYAAYAKSTAKRRRWRRLQRGVVRLGFAALIAVIVLLFDTGATELWKFAGAAGLALVAFSVDPLIDRWADDHWKRSQIKALIEAVERSEFLLGQLLLRESQLNGIRALRELPPVEFVRRTTLERPLP